MLKRDVLALYAPEISRAEVYARDGIASSGEEALSALAAEVRNLREQAADLSAWKETIVQLAGDDLILHVWGGPWVLDPLALHLRSKKQGNLEFPTLDAAVQAAQKGAES